MFYFYRRLQVSCIKSFIASPKRRLRPLHDPGFAFPMQLESIEEVAPDDHHALKRSDYQIDEGLSAVLGMRLHLQ
jgi:hypothetical protein